MTGNIPWFQRAAHRDFVRGIASWRVWLHLGMGDIRIRYKRTVLGPLWVTLSMAGTFISMGMLFSAVYKTDIHQFLPFLAAGMVTWNTMSALATESPGIFVQSQHIINTLRMPMTIHVLRATTRNAMILSYNMAAAMASHFLLGGALTAAHALLLITLPLFLGTLSAAALILAIIGARFRDVGPIIGVTLQFLFFMTPIFWTVDALPLARKWWITANPLYHLVEIVRAPMLGQVPSALSFGVSVSTLITLMVVGYFLFCRFRGRIAYWI